MKKNPANTIKGIAKELSKFPCVSCLDDVQLSDGLLGGSIPKAAVIACSDMGWLVPYVCSSAKVQLLLFQNFGHRFDTGGFVEALVESNVGNVVVYGHSVCQYTRFLARSYFDKRSGDSLQPAPDNHHLQLYSDALQSDSETLWEKVGQFNVLSELKRMLTDPIVAPLAASGKLKMHGWFFDSVHRQLQVFDPKKEAFVVQYSELPNGLVLKFIPDRSHVPED